MKYFHGKIVKGLSKLKPNAFPFSNLKEPVVYLTTNRQLALHYIWDMKRIGVKMPMFDICKDGTLVFQEMFSDIFIKEFRDMFTVALATTKSILMLA